MNYQSRTKLIRLNANLPTGLTEGHDLTIHAVKLVGQPSRASNRCTHCGAPYEPVCPYCGAKNRREHAELIFKDFGSGHVAGSYALESLYPEPLSLAPGINVARNDRIDIWINPPQNAEVILYMKIAVEVMS